MCYTKVHTVYFSVFIDYDAAKVYIFTDIEKR
jgi:hypothetical protein